MNYINLFLLCKILICVLYSIAASLLVCNTSKTLKKNPNQLFRRRMLALSFGSLSVLYSCNLVVFSLFPHLPVEENLVTVLILLTLSVFSVLWYLLRMVSETDVLLIKRSKRRKVALTGCIIICYVIVKFFDIQWFHTLAAHYAGGVIWVCQISLQGYLIHKIECAIKNTKSQHRHTRLFAYTFNTLGVVTFPVFLLFPGSYYWQMLQLIIWIFHFWLFFYICRKDALMFVYPDYLQTSGLLFESPQKYESAVDTSMFGDLYERLSDYFKKEKPYLKSGINVGDVAIHLSSNKSYLSRLLNDKLNLNFNQFVNSYRIKEAQRLVTESGNLSLHELCKRVGFTSMATFTVAFKLNTGMTPGEWCKKQKKSS